jgi:hypothetical protein
VIKDRWPPSVDFAKLLGAALKPTGRAARIGALLRNRGYR